MHAAISPVTCVGRYLDKQELEIKAFRYIALRRQNLGIITVYLVPTFPQVLRDGSGDGILFSKVLLVLLQAFAKIMHPFT